MQSRLLLSRARAADLWSSWQLDRRETCLPRWDEQKKKGTKCNFPARTVSWKGLIIPVFSTASTSPTVAVASSVTTGGVASLSGLALWLMRKLRKNATKFELNRSDEHLSLLMFTVICFIKTFIELLSSCSSSVFFSQQLWHRGPHAGVQKQHRQPHLEHEQNIYTLYRLYVSSVLAVTLCTIWIHYICIKPWRSELSMMKEEIFFQALHVMVVQCFGEYLEWISWFPLKCCYDMHFLPRGDLHFLLNTLFCSVMNM